LSITVAVVRALWPEIERIARVLSGRADFNAGEIRAAARPS
jgi:hypothetical protein